MARHAGGHALALDVVHRLARHVHAALLDEAVAHAAMHEGRHGAGMDRLLDPFLTFSWTDPFTEAAGSPHPRTNVSWKHDNLIT